MDVDGADTRSQMVRQRTLQRSGSVGALRPARLEVYVTDANTRMGHGMVLHCGNPDIGSTWHLVLHGGRHWMQTNHVSGAGARRRGRQEHRYSSTLVSLTFENQATGQEEWYDSTTSRSSMA